MTRRSKRYLLIKNRRKAFYKLWGISGKSKNDRKNDREHVKLSISTNLVTPEWKEADASEVKFVVNAKADEREPFLELKGNVWSEGYVRKILTENLDIIFSSNKKHGVLLLTQDKIGGWKVRINGTKVPINKEPNKHTIISFIYDEVKKWYVFTYETNIIGDFTGKIK